MNSNEYKTRNQILSLFFVIVPTILLVLGYFFYPTNPADPIEFLIQIPIFLGLILLFIGFLTNKYLRKNLKDIWLDYFCFLLVHPTSKFICK